MNNQVNDLFDDQLVIPHLKQQLIAIQPATPNVYFDAPDIELDYDIAVVCMSGGKDSLASLKHLLDLGFPKSKIEMWHHLVDGAESKTSFMDWPFIDDYCVQLSKALGIPLYFSWLQNGFLGEMLKENSISQPYSIETPDGTIELPRLRAKRGTRLKYPQQAASLQTRWCSSVLKIDVGRRGITSQERFIGKKVLFITGERREESGNRARYNQLEPHLTDTIRSSTHPKKPRHVDHWRPALNFSEENVWEILESWNMLPPIPYRVGFSRSSCQTCIFNSDRIWATILHYWPDRLEAILRHETKFDLTISRKGENVLERAKKSKPLKILDEEAFLQTQCKKYKLPIFLPKDRAWSLPSGAFSKDISGAF